MKKIVLLLLMFLTVGCSAKYDLTINNNKITEELTLTSEIEDVMNKERYYNEFLDEYPVFTDDEFLYYAPTQKIKGVKYYQKDIVENDYGYVATYKANYNFEQYKKSRIFDMAFKVKYASLDKDIYSIYAESLKIFKANNNLDYKQVNINLKNHEVINSNAHQIIGNTYTWNFNKNDVSTIELEFKEKRVISNIPIIDNNNNQIENNDNSISLQDLLIITISICSFFVVLVLIIIFHNKKAK